VSPEPREPLRVEQALRLLPDVDVLAPLRALLVASSRRRQEPAATEPYATVGKRVLHPAGLRAQISQVLARVVGHLTRIYDAALDALEAEQRGDMTAAVRALLRAAEGEEEAGRFAHLEQWCTHVLRIAEELRDRRPEIAALRQAARLETARGHLGDAARAYQRSLALAEAEMDPVGVALACEGLGNLALARSEWRGAESWFRRGLRYEASDPLLGARLTFGLAEVERGRHDVAAAQELFRSAHAMFEAIPDEPGAVRVVHAEGLLAAAAGDTGVALGKYLEALQRLERAGGSPPLELAVRLSLCELHLESGQLPAAEDEGRRGEDLAIRHDLPRHLARFYVAMGKLRGKRSDESGFVFFEQALEICHGREPAPRLEMEVLVEYARFRAALGGHEEARDCIERAREIADLLGDEREVRRLDAEFGQMSAR
jgi:tetratricopeptide (TPR) repeat protein